MKKEVSKKSNPKIKCDVLTCLYNDCSDNCCKLEEIRVSCSCCNDEVNNKDETICNSYKKSNN